MTTGSIDDPTDPSNKYVGVAVTTSESTDPYECNASASVKVSGTGTLAVDITMEGMKFSSAMPMAITFVARGIEGTLSEEDRKYHFSSSTVVPEIGGVPTEQFTMSNFAGVFDEYNFKLEFDITISSVDYHVLYDTTIPPSYSYYGESTTTSSSTVPFQSEASAKIELNSLGSPFTVDVTMEGMKFSSSMPMAITFRVKNVNCVISEEDKKSHFSLSSVVPEIGGIPSESYTMRNFKGVFDDAGYTLEFDFTMSSVEYHVKYESVVVK